MRVESGQARRQDRSPGRGEDSARLPSSALFQLASRVGRPAMESQTPESGPVSISSPQDVGGGVWVEPLVAWSTAMRPAAVWLGPGRCKVGRAFYLIQSGIASVIVTDCDGKARSL